MFHSTQSGILHDTLKVVQLLSLIICQSRTHTMKHNRIYGLCIMIPEFDLYKAEGFSALPVNLIYYYCKIKIFLSLVLFEYLLEALIKSFSYNIYTMSRN